MNCHRHKSFWKRNINKNEYFYAILQAVTVIMIITYLFYHSIWAVAPFLFLLIPYIHLWEINQEKKQKEEFQMQFKDFLQALMTALRAGYAMENAIYEAKKELEKQYDGDARIRKDLDMMGHLIEMNVSVEEAWQAWSSQLEIEVLEQFTTVFILSKKSGGDSVAIIKNAINNICSSLEVETEIRVILTAKRLEFYIMSIVPLGMIFYMKLSFQEFMSVLYGNIFGTVFMSLCLGIYALAFYWGNKIIQIEV